MTKAPSCIALVTSKLASRLAKENPDGVVDLTSPVVLNEVLSRTPVSDIWGINSHRAKALNQVGINTALQLREADEQWIRRHMHVTVLRLVYELCGINALPLDLAPSPPRSIMRARAFGKPVRELEALAVFVARAAEKLRVAGRAALAMSVFLTTNRFRAEGQEKLYRLMNAIDELNARYGHDTVRFASLGYASPWSSRSAQRSPRYTTQWGEIVVVLA